MSTNHYEGATVLEKMADSRAGTGKVQNDPGASIVPESKDNFEESMGPYPWDTGPS